MEQVWMSRESFSASARSRPSRRSTTGEWPARGGVVSRQAGMAFQHATMLDEHVPGQVRLGVGGHGELTPSAMSTRVA